MDQIQKKKIGVLIPQSNTFPLMGKAFLNGFKLAIGDLNCDYFVEGIGSGADAKQLLNSYQKLSYQNSVDITTGLLGHHGYRELSHFVSQNDEVLVAADLGAKKPFQTPNGVYQNSLGLYDSLQSLVQYFESNSIAKIASSTCYYESGYDFVAALSDSLDATEKVEFAGHFITPLHPRENESELMFETMQAVDPDAIVAFHNTVYAKEHAEFLSKNELQNKYPIYALPFTCAEDVIEKFPTVLEKIKVVSSWYPTMENATNQKFIIDYQKSYNKQPDFFALLGYENGLVIREALTQNERSIQDTLKAINIEGPRGPINFNENHNRTTYTNYLWEIKNDSSQGLSKKMLDKLEQPSALDTSQQNEQAGWYNSYLCH